MLSKTKRDEGDRMRRATNPTRKISITIPGKLFEEINQHLSYDQSRSKFIANAIQEYFNHESDLNAWSNVELIEHLQYQFVKDSPEDVLIQSLLKLVTSKASA